MPYKDLVKRAKYQNNYRKSFKGHAVRMWSALKLRTRLKAYNKICTKEDFMKKVLNDGNYCRLYSEWKNSDFEYKLTPTTDRINNDIGYLLENIQFMTQLENVIKQNKLTAKEIVWAGTTYNSISELARSLKLNQSTVSEAVNKGYKIKGKKVIYAIC